MTTRERLRHLPPVCALLAVANILAGRLRFQRRHVGSTLVMEDLRAFRVFRHLSMTQKKAGPAVSPVVLVVRFRFARGSQRLNRLLSLLPVPVIAGSPGFRDKVWMVDEDGWWQGVYEWESPRAAEVYRSSLVFRTMERRAAPGSLSCTVVDSLRLSDWMERRGVPADPQRTGGESP